MPLPTDPYKTLGVSTDTPPHKIDKALWKLMQTCYSDPNANEKISAERSKRFRETLQAYNTVDREVKEGHDGKKAELGITRSWWEKL